MTVGEHFELLKKYDNYSKPVQSDEQWEDYKAKYNELKDDISQMSKWRGTESSLDNTYLAMVNKDRLCEDILNKMEEYKPESIDLI